MVGSRQKPQEESQAGDSAKSSCAQQAVGARCRAHAHLQVAVVVLAQQLQEAQDGLHDEH